MVSNNWLQSHNGFGGLRIDSKGSLVGKAPARLAARLSLEMLMWKDRFSILALTCKGSPSRSCGDVVCFLYRHCHFFQCRHQPKKRGPLRVSHSCPCTASNACRHQDLQHFGRQVAVSQLRVSKPVFLMELLFTARDRARFLTRSSWPLGSVAAPVTSACNVLTLCQGPVSWFCTMFFIRQPGAASINRNKTHHLLRLLLK